MYQSSISTTDGYDIFQRITVELKWCDHSGSVSGNDSGYIFGTMGTFVPDTSIRATEGLIIAPGQESSGII